VKDSMRNIAASYLLLILIVPGVMADAFPLRVINAEGEEIAALEVLDRQEEKYVLLEEVSRLFSGTRKHERFSGRVTVTMRGKRIVFTPERHQLKIDDEEYILSNPPISVLGKVAIPVQFLTEVLPGVIGRQITLDREKWVLQISQEPFVERGALEAGSYILPESTSVGFRVIIDPGHGGYDVGARGEAAMLEKDLTLEISQRVKDLLTAEEGIDAYLTRSRDDYMSPSERVNFANKLRGRIFLSIHFNWSPSQRSRGFRTYVNSNRMRLGAGSELEADMFSRAKPAAGSFPGVDRFLPQSKRLAKEITNHLKDMGLPGQPDKEAFLAGMDSLSMPGVLVELLYLSNQQDLLIFSSPGFIDSVSRAICDSIISFKSAVKDKAAL